MLKRRSNIRSRIAGVWANLGPRRKAWRKKRRQAVRDFGLLFGYDIRRTQLRRLSSSTDFFSEPPLNPNSTSSLPACLVMLVSGAELEALTVNTLESLRLTGHTLPILVYTTRGSLKMIQRIQAYYEFSIEVIEANQGFAQGSYAGFGSTEFNKFTNLKWTALLDAFDKGYELVTFTDCDISFRTNYESYVRGASKVYSCGVQSESRNVFPPQFCTGFMYFRAEAVPLLRFLQESAIRNAGLVNDQVLFNEVVSSNPDLIPRVQLLPEAVFMNGMQFGAIASKRHPLQVHVVEPVLFHANYVAGVAQKEELLRDGGLWHTPDVNFGQIS